MKIVHIVAFLLLVVGGLNWGLLALTGWDISQLLGGMNSMLAKALFVLVGLAAVVELVMHKKNCKTCSGMKKASTPPPSETVAPPTAS